MRPGIFRTNVRLNMGHRWSDGMLWLRSLRCAPRRGFCCTPSHSNGGASQRGWRTIDDAEAPVRAPVADEDIMGLGSHHYLVSISEV
jgi:hypothetical protein